MWLSPRCSRVCLPRPTSGFYGSITQSLRGVQPAWQGALAVMILLTFSTHSLQFVVHGLRGTPNLFTSIAASLCFTAISALFNWYAMRRGALIIGDGQSTLAADMRQMPRIVVGLLAANPRSAIQLASRL